MENFLLPLTIRMMKLLKRVELIDFEEYVHIADSEENDDYDDVEPYDDLCSSLFCARE